LTDGYSYLILETDRSASYHQNIQYVDEDSKTYRGTRMDKNQVKIELYSVSNLIGSEITGVNALTHIGV
jgi:hypothetical protein